MTDEPKKAAPLATRAPQQLRSVLTPRNMAQMRELCEFLAASDIIPDEYRGKPGNIAIAVDMGLSVNMTPAQALQSIAVINGKPTIYGDAVPGVCMQHRKWEWMKETFDEETFTATCTVKRQGEPEHTIKYSKEDATVAGLWGKKTSKGYPTPWITDPKRMIQMRARRALRDKYPDALKGLAIYEDYVGVEMLAPGVELQEVRTADRPAEVRDALTRRAEAVDAAENPIDVSAETEPPPSTSAPAETSRSSAQPSSDTSSTSPKKASTTRSKASSTSADSGASRPIDQDQSARASDAPAPATSSNGADAPATTSSSGATAAPSTPKPDAPSDSNLDNGEQLLDPKSKLCQRLHITLEHYFQRKDYRDQSLALMTSRYGRRITSSSHLLTKEAIELIGHLEYQMRPREDGE